MPAPARRRWAQVKIKYVQLDSSAFFTDLDFITMPAPARLHLPIADGHRRRRWAQVTLEERGIPAIHRNISGPPAAGIDRNPALLGQSKTLIPENKNQNF